MQLARKEVVPSLINQEMPYLHYVCVRQRAGEGFHHGKFEVWKEDQVPDSNSSTFGDIERCSLMMWRPAGSLHKVRDIEINSRRGL